MVLVLFSYVSAKLRNALTDFIRTTEFTGFQREARAAFCTAVMYLYMLCILAVAVNVMSRRY